MNNFLVLFYAWLSVVCLMAAHYYHHLQDWLFPVKEKHQPVKVRLFLVKDGNISEMLHVIVPFELDAEKRYFEATFQDLARAISMVQSLRYVNSPETLKLVAASFGMIEVGGKMRFLTTHFLKDITRNRDWQKVLKIQNMFERLQPAYDDVAYKQLLGYMKGK